MSRSNHQGKKKTRRTAKRRRFISILILILLLCISSVIACKTLYKEQEKSDTTGNTEQEYDNKKEDKSKDDKSSKNKTSKGYTIVTKDGVTSIDGIKIVNKTYSVPENYGNGLTPECEKAYKDMQKDMQELNLPCKMRTGYRSCSMQREIYNKYVREDGKANADTYSARPCYSEHHLGECMDVNSLDQSFGDTPEGKWIADNCWKYGFIIRYPKGKEDITGYMYEPWHIRYVGKSLAKKLYNGGDWIPLEEHFGITSKYPD
ncbi:MAG: M15 family metallopeptidase [Eubacteriales bacterium]|nr:M15 family metallopeptidase [Eubacteriales bacterium]MDY3332204.1 M15 family metallopeptidase [Gallibacter sp.]